MNKPSTLQTVSELLASDPNLNPTFAELMAQPTTLIECEHGVLGPCSDCDRLEEEDHLAYLEASNIDDGGVEDIERERDDDESDDRNYISSLFEVEN